MKHVLKRALNVVFMYSHTERVALAEPGFGQGGGGARNFFRDFAKVAKWSRAGEPILAGVQGPP